MKKSQQVEPIDSRAAERYWKATVARDSRSDGVFFLGVRSTRIYCRPSCPARRPLRRNVEFFRTQREAEQRGFRACLRCKPNEISAATALVQKAASLLAQNGEESPRLGAIARQLGTSTSRLRRSFSQVTGLSPRELAEALRLDRFKKLLRQGSKITDALYETGYGSSSRVYERSNAQLGMTPATYQKGGKGMKLGFTIAKATVGRVLVAATERGVSAVYLGDSEAKLLAELRAEYPRAEIAPAHSGLEKWVKEIVSRTEGNPPRRELPLDLMATAFQRRVWQELQNIPMGKTRTYAEVARSLGRPSASRAVARACATNPVSIVVPCHRVIRGDGNLAGYRWGIERKQQLLKKERAEAGARN
ncbi:MAG TPA: bifunctional DNA-binding transcriptional regulator/O6-methylguanine-DNA methyltransferase Ada [Candidatus Acidoferrum sp.]|nr:bifunctional DNA-binding transcriptional regulator/O6-methylguanine-DNA methyltransferase Ada [Candidatus Acidoferrum sp.]